MYRRLAQGFVTLLLALLAVQVSAAQSWAMSLRIGDPLGPVIFSGIEPGTFVTANDGNASGSGAIEIPLDSAPRLPKVIRFRASGNAALPKGTVEIEIRSSTGLLQVGSFTDVTDAASAVAGAPSFTVKAGGTLACPGQRTSYTINRMSLLDVAPRAVRRGVIVNLSINFTTVCTGLGGQPRMVGSLSASDSSLGSPHTAFVRGQAWNDVNGDGVREAGEPPLVGAFVIVDNVLGPPTDSNGRYEILVPSGRHKVAIDTHYAVSAAGELTFGNKLYAPTLTDAGGDDTLDSDFPSAASGATGNLSLTLADAAAPVFDAGFTEISNALSGHLWLDVDRDGLRDDGEPAIIGASVCITHRDIGQTQLPERQTCLTSDRGGRVEALIRGLTLDISTLGGPSGSRHTLMDQGADETRDSDFDAATSSTRSVTPGAPPAQLDLGFVTDARTVVGVAWNDQNADGIRQPNEPTLPDVTVELLREGLDAPLHTVSTDENGVYYFNMFDDATYHVRVAGESTSAFTGYALTVADSGADDALDSDFDAATSTSPALGTGLTEHLDAGFRVTPRGVIDGVVWDDSNANGLRDAREGPPTLRPVIELRQDGRRMTTIGFDSAGTYSIAVPVGHDYRLLHMKDSDYSATRRGTDGDLDSDIDERSPAFQVTSAHPTHRDLGVVLAAVKHNAARDFFPLVVGTSWNYKNARGQRASCVIASRLSTGAYPFKCTGGTTIELGTGARGLMLYGMKFDDGKLQAKLLTPVLLAGGAGTRYPLKGSVFADGQAVFDGKTIKARIKLAYTSKVLPVSGLDSSANDTRDEFVSFDSRARIQGGGSLTFAFSLKLERDVGPVAIYNTATPGVGGWTLLRASVDLDRDGKPVLLDNCPQKSNANQADLDRDAVGDACDADLDDDRVANARDNCPRSWNPEQLDSDGNGVGDACQ